MTFFPGVWKSSPSFGDSFKMSGILGTDQTIHMHEPNPIHIIRHCPLNKPTEMSSPVSFLYVDHNTLGFFLVREAAYGRVVSPELGKNMPQSENCVIVDLAKKPSHSCSASTMPPNSWVEAPTKPSGQSQWLQGGSLGIGLGVNRHRLCQQHLGACSLKTRTWAICSWFLFVFVGKRSRNSFLGVVFFEQSEDLSFVGSGRMHVITGLSMRKARGNLTERVTARALVVFRFSATKFWVLQKHKLLISKLVKTAWSVTHVT